MNRPFVFKEGVYFVEGAKFASLCDTNSGNVYSINPSAKNIILGQKEDSGFHQRLLEMNLLVSAEDSEDFPTIVQLRRGQDISLEFIWFEIIGSDCNERCVHCYSDSMPPSYRKAMGFIPLVSIQRGKPPETRVVKRLSYDKWAELIREGAALGCKQCQFIGGEPFVYRGEFDETVLDLAEIAKLAGYDFVEIFTNATLLTPSKISRIKRLGVQVAVSLYSIRPEIHDAVTRTPGSLLKTKQSLESLKSAEVPTRVEVILMHTNQSSVEETIQWIEANGFQHRSPDVLRPKGRGDSPELTPDVEFVIEYGLMTRPNFRAERSFFIRSVSGHNCLGGKITITENGDVLPCIFSRNHVMDNVSGVPLKDVVTSPQLQRVWNSTKDNVFVCRDCEYRYVCFDCRPISEAFADGKADYLSAPYPRCTYNPYTGEWAKGVWRMNEEGKPFYDRSIGQLIQENTNRNDISKATSTGP